MNGPEQFGKRSSACFSTDNNISYIISAPEHLYQTAMMNDQVQSQTRINLYVLSINHDTFTFISVRNITV